MAEESSKPQVLQRKWLSRSRLFHVEELQLRFGNGAERTYECINPQRSDSEPHRAVMIVAMLDSETVLLVREYGAGIGDYYLSLPKGAIHRGETLFETADRELKEEAGYGARKFDSIKQLHLSPSYMGNHITIMLARNLYEQSLPGDEPEPLQVVPYKLSQLGELVARQEFREAYAVAALYMVRDYLESQ